MRVMKDPTPRIGAAVEADVFGPEDVVVLRASLDQAWNALPPERWTEENVDALAAAISVRGAVEAVGHHARAVEQERQGRV